MKKGYKQNPELSSWYEALSEDEQAQADILYRSTEQHPRAGFEADEAEIEAELALLKTRTIKKYSVKAYRKYVFLAAAVLLLSLGLGWAFYTTPVEVRAPYGEIVSTELPDGSMVELNSGASISYSRFGFKRDAREITLSGEAYFDVAHSELPFKVQTHNANIQVLGTSFTVRAWDTDVNRQTSVYLESGSLSFSSNHYPQQDMLLEPGHLSYISLLKPTPTKPEPVASDQAMAWRNQGLFYSSVPISVIFSDIERRFNTPVEVADPSILNESLSLFMSSPQSAEHVISAIAAEKNLRFEKYDGRILLFASN